MSIHTKTALDAIKRSPFQAISAVFVLSLTFFVATMVTVLVYSSNVTIKYFETRPQIIAFLKDEITNNQAVELREKLGRDLRLKDVKYVAKEEALEIYKKATEDNPLLAELVSPSIFPASIEFSVVDLSSVEKIISEIENEPQVEQIGFTANLGSEKSLGDVINRLKTAGYYIRVGGLVFVSLLALSSFSVLLVIITMRMASRKNEIEILSLIGATPQFVRSPVIIEAIIYSITGVVVGWILAFIFWLYLTPLVMSYFGQIPLLPKEPLQFFMMFAIILGIELVIGFLVAFVGSMTAVKRSLKKAR